jgi:hypothetical protein
MWRPTIVVLMAWISAPAHASYIYELTGHIESIGDAQSVPDVLHVGDTFRASMEYYSTPGGTTNSGPCTDQASLISVFDFGHLEISSAGIHAGGCMLNGISPIFFSPLGATGELAGWGNNGSPWTLPLNGPLFPDDISDDVWAATRLELRLFGPSGLESPIVQYYVVFDQLTAVPSRYIRRGMASGWYLGMVAWSDTQRALQRRIY